MAVVGGLREAREFPRMSEGSIRQEIQLADFIGDAIDGAEIGPSSLRTDLKLLLYGYATGRLSSRSIAQATRRPTPFQRLAGDERPERQELIEFRRAHRNALETAFRQIFQLCKALKVSSLGRLDLSGEKAPLEVVHFLLERAEQLDQLESQVAALPQLAFTLPPGLDDPQTRRAKLAALLQIPPVLSLPQASVARPAQSATPKSPNNSGKGKRKRPGLSRIRDSLRSNVPGYLLLAVLLIVLGGIAMVSALPDTPKTLKQEVAAQARPEQPPDKMLVGLGSGLLGLGTFLCIFLLTLDPAGRPRRRSRKKASL